MESMPGTFRRALLASALVTTVTSSLCAQGSFILGVDDWTFWGGVVNVDGPWSGVTVTEVEPNDDHLSANMLAVGDDFSGVIAVGGTERDYAAFTVAANDSIVAELVDIGGMWDSKLWLYDTDGVTRLAFNDDGGHLYLSKISYTFSTAGTYYLAVGPYDSSNDGAYSMQLRTTGHFGAAGSWVYIRKALEAVAPGVTRVGADGSVAVLGSSDSTVTFGDAGAAYHFCVPLAAVDTPLSGTVTFHDTAAAMAAFFSDLAAGSLNPSIIVLAGSAADNDMDAVEAAELANNAAAIGAYLASGGGLISHGDSYSDAATSCYGWLPQVFPGAAVEQRFTSPALTNEGGFRLPAIDDADGYYSAEGCFTGHGLDVYWKSPGDAVLGPWSGVTVSELEVNDDYSTANPLVIGDDAAGSITAGGADEDTFAFALGEGDFISLRTVHVSGVDTTLSLYDTDGTTLIEFDDDGAGYPYSLIEFIAPAGGMYYVAVGSYGTYTGAYSMETRTATPHPGDDVIVGSLPSPWSWLGNALSGAGGEPLAVPTGTLQAGSYLTLSLTRAAPTTTAFLIVGLQAVNAPVKGGVLVPANDAIVPLATGAVGELFFGGILGAPPSGASFYVQYWIVDAAGPAGYSASNAFSGTIP